jgi:hypothetical protein
MVQREATVLVLRATQAAATFFFAFYAPKWPLFSSFKMGFYTVDYFFLLRYKDGAVLTLQKSSHYCTSKPKRCQEIGVELYELTFNLLTLVCMCFMEMKREFSAVKNAEKTV